MSDESRAWPGGYDPDVRPRTAWIDLDEETKRSAPPESARVVSLRPLEHFRKSA